MLADVDDRLEHDPRQRDSERSVVNGVSKAQDMLCRWTTRNDRLPLAH